jgi:hypothetical protein
MSLAVRTASPSEPTPSLPEPEPNKYGAETNIESLEPLEMREKRHGDVLLESLGIDDTLNTLPTEDQDNAAEIKTYVKNIMEAKGLTQTVGSFKKTLDSIKQEMGLDEDADPQVILDRIGGVLKAWKNLTFISNPQEKRSLFMKLARQPSSEAMNKLVFEEMERRKIWR